MHQPTPIAPTLEIPVETDAYGKSFVYPRIHIDQSLGLVTLTQQKQSMSAWERVKYEAPAWAFGVCVLALVVFLWRLRRVWRTPQTPGRWSCRRCGYDVTEPDRKTVLAQCPECGLDTGRRKPVMGRSGVRRMAARAVLVVGALGLMVAVGMWGLRRPRTFITGIPVRAWPPLVAPVMPAWMRLEHEDARTETTGTVEVWSLMEKRRLAAYDVPAVQPGWHNTLRQARTLPGGKAVAITTEEIKIQIEIKRLADGATLWTSNRSDMMDARCAGLAGSSEDGTRAWVWHGVRDDVPGVKVVLREVDLNTGVTTDVGEIHLTKDPDVWGMTGALAVQDGARVKWVAMNISEVGWIGEADGKTTVVPLAAGVPPEAARLVKTATGWSVVGPCYAPGGIVATGALSVPLAVGGTQPQAAAGKFVFNDPTWDYLDAASGKVVVRLLPAGVSLGYWEPLAQGDRWYAKTGARVRGEAFAWAGMASYEGVVLVWEVGPDVNGGAGAK